MEAKEKAKIKYKLLRAYRRFLAVFFPERCPYCNKVIYYGEVSCDRCREGLIRDSLKRNAVGDYPTISAVPYIDHFANGVKELKFKNGIQFAPLLAKVMAESIRKSYRLEDIDFITFVPLYPSKQKERGYNQSELLAKELSYLLELPLEKSLIKVKDNLPQHQTDAVGRRENVKGVFAVSEKCDVKSKNILLIDDVITTGNTLGEAARMLKLASAHGIYCATFACAVAKTT